MNTANVDAFATGSRAAPAMSMHPHPTLTETIMEDAELVHGSATHYYKPPRG